MFTFNRNINLLVIAVVLSSFLPATVISTSLNASVASSQMVTDDGGTLTSRDIDEIKVKRALEHKLVSERLKSAGLSDEEVDKKIAKMSDEELHQLASMSDRIPAGGHAAGVLISALALVAAVFLVIYILERRT